MRIETAHLLLRDFVEADIDQYEHLRSHPKFQRFYSEEDSAPTRALELLSLFIEQSRAVPRLKYQLAITLKSGELIGSCGVRIEEPGVASIGCELGREWQGSGFALEAGKAMIDFGFRQLGLQRIFAETLAENLAAVRLCRMLGMMPESERVNDSSFKARDWNTVIMAIHRQTPPA